MLNCWCTCSLKVNVTSDIGAVTLADAAGAVRSSRLCAHAAGGTARIAATSATTSRAARRGQAARTVMVLSPTTNPTSGPRSPAATLAYTPRMSSRRSPPPGQATEDETGQREYEGCDTKPETE